MDVRCPVCNTPVVRQFEAPPGAQVQGYCDKCKLEVTVRRRRVLDTVPKK